MGEIIGKAVAFMAVILLGAGLRKIGFLKKEDFRSAVPYCAEDHPSGSNRHEF